jgi:hypothetical protein
MAIMVVFHAPGMTQAQYDALRPVVQWESNQPEGIVFHSCGFDEAGGLHVTDVWDTPEQAQHFFETRLKPGFDAVGITNPPAPKIMAAHNVDCYPGCANYAP